MILEQQLDLFRLQQSPHICIANREIIEQRECGVENLLVFAPVLQVCDAKIGLILPHFHPFLTFSPRTA